ncbi:hypothetical protein AAH991_39555 [Microbispora sp. ZYX-F-249]|uniref:Uncharacterized protein n=1 Tax=Microbispora maris TaxID=3144104 RepID=A0ABV0B160_9ACTN
MVSEVVKYECGTDEAAETQDVRINVELTMPDNATAGQQMSIGWRGTYVTGSELRVPAAGLPGGVKLYAYAALTGIEGLTSATGVSEPLSITAGQTIPLPQTAVSMKTTSSRAGEASVRPAAINVGSSPTSPLIECEVRNAGALTPYTLTVAQGSQASTSPTPDAATTSPKPTRTLTTTVTAFASGDADLDEEIPAAGDVDATPAGGAATGGGGEAGPDGRMYVLTGLVIACAAGAGLLLRRRIESG